MKNLKVSGVILLIIISLIASPFLSPLVFAEEGNQETITGTSEDEVLIGDNNQNDIIDGGAGDDIAVGGAGNDIINGRDGNDILFGGAGDDEINGDAGDDILIGDDGDDILNGGDGDDIIYGDAGNDTAEFDVDSSNASIQIGNNANGDLLLNVDTETGRDSLENIENLEFEDKQVNDIVFVPLNGYLSRMQRNPDGTYTAFWGYENNNDYDAFHDVNYFEDNSTTTENNAMIFEKGKHESAISTIVKDLIQKWILGDQEILADASGLEAEYQQDREDRRDARRERLELELYRKRLVYIQDLLEKGVLQQNVFTQDFIQGNITVGEYIDLLTRATGLDPKQLSNIGYKNDDILTKEQMAVITLTAFNVEPTDNHEFVFTDDDNISDFAKGYVYAAGKQGIITEIGFPFFAPQNNVARYEAYRIISSYLKLMK